MEDKSGVEQLRRKLHGPITSVNDIIYRGMSPAPVITDYANDRLSFWQRLINKAYTRWLGAQLIEDTSVAKSRQPVTAFTLNPGANPRIPMFDYGELVQIAQNHWLLRTIFRAIIGEVINAGWDIKPRFKYKCRNCGREYDTPEKPDACEICGGKRFDTPDIEQYKEFARLLKDPAPGQDRTFTEFIRSTLWYALALDDFYWEIGYTQDYNPLTGKYEAVPRGIRVLNAAITVPLQDVYGNYTSDEYFCPRCYKEQYLETGMDTYVKPMSYGGSFEVPVCERCGGKMERTAFKQVVNGKTVARFTADEVIHSSTERVDPNVFGFSKVAAAIKHLLVLDYMDEYNYQIYSHGHVSKLLFLVGSDRDEIERVMAQVNNALSATKRRDVQTGEARRSLETAIVMIGQEEGKDVRQVDIMPDLSAMQSLDYYRLYVNKVCGLYGVTPTFVNYEESMSNTRNSRVEIEVQNRVTRRYMQEILEPFNNKLLPRLGITDWVLEFGPIESRDMLRDAQIKLTNIQAASLAIKAGFDVEMEPDASKYRISPKPVHPPEPRAREESGRTPQDLDGAPTRTIATGTEQGVPLLEPEVEQDEA